MASYLNCISRFLFVFLVGVLCLPHFLEARNTFPTHKEFNRYFYFESQLKKGQVTAARATLDSMYVHKTHRFITKKAKLDLARYYLKKGDTKRAKNWVYSVLSYTFDEVINTQATLILIEIAMMEHDINTCLFHYNYLLRHNPKIDADKTLLYSFQKHFNQSISSKDIFKDKMQHLSYVQRLYKEEMWVDFLGNARFLSSQYTSTTIQKNVHYLLGKYYLEHYLYEKAINHFKLAKKYRLKHDFLHDAEYRMGLAYEGLNQPGAAILMYKKVLKRIQLKRPLKHKIYYKLVKLLKKEGPYQEYKETLKEFERFSFRSFEYSSFVWDQAWFKYQYKAITNLPMRNKAKPVMSRYPELKMSYLTYQELLPVFKQNSRKHTLLTDIDWLMRQNKSSIALDSLLYIQEQNRDESSQYLEAESYIYRKKKRYDKLLAMDDRTKKMIIKGGTYSPNVVKNRYPLVYWDTVKLNANKYRVDPYLIMALMRVKSGFNTRLVSGKDIGLFQMDMGLAKELAYRLGLYWKGYPTLTRPEKSIKIASFYWRHLLNKNDQNYYVTLIDFLHGSGISSRYNAKKRESRQTYLNALPSDYHRKLVSEVNQTYIIYSMLYR